MPEEVLVVAVGMADRRQPLEETNYWLDTPRYIGVNIVNYVET